MPPPQLAIEPPRAAFFDRDGVLNELVATPAGLRAPWSSEELRIDPAALPVVRSLRARGFEPVIVSNQPDIAAGQLSRPAADEIDLLVRGGTGIERSIICPHVTIDGCDCRKPLPGMLLSAARRWGLSLEGSWLVGDRWVDIAAGRAAGASTILLERPYSWDASSSGAPAADLAADVVCHDLSEVGAIIR
jgi:D-glycero-D-manno-heptose 1,7-bisphosphate phosphatase